MNTTLASMIATLFIFTLAAVAAETASDAPIPQATGDVARAAPKETEAAVPGSASQSGTEKSPADDKPAEPITGAFGIPLGEPFVASMVAEVLGEQAQTYRGKDDAQLKGTLYRVKPNQPDQRFQAYSVKTTDKGLVYAIQGEHRIELEDQDKGDEDKQDQAVQGTVDPAQSRKEKAERAKALTSSCKAAVKALTGELEAKYGKPRGGDRFGTWVSFRQISDTENKSIRLYGHRCRTGRYNIVYSDEKPLHGIPAKAVKSSEPVRIKIRGPEKRVMGAAPEAPASNPEGAVQPDAESSAKP